MTTSTHHAPYASDLAGRHYVITGANTGVGRATARALSERGAHVVLACRSEERARPVLDEISASGRGAATFIALDLADLTSVSRAADAITGYPHALDAVILNAAVAGARGVTRQGFELAFGVNYLGHFALLRRLLPSLSPGARVVHLGSGSHRTTKRLDLGAMRTSTRSWTGIREYAASKLCVMLFHHALSERVADAGVVSCVADPGDVASDAWRHVPWPIRPLLTRGMKAPTDGAAASLYCATHAAVRPGASYTSEGEDTPSPLARDPELAEELWGRSEEWVDARQSAVQVY